MDSRILMYYKLCSATNAPHHPLTGVIEKYPLLSPYFKQSRGTLIARESIIGANQRAKQQPQQPQQPRPQQLYKKIIVF